MGYKQPFVCEWHAGTHLALAYRTLNCVVHKLLELFLLLFL